MPEVNLSSDLPSGSENEGQNLDANLMRRVIDNDESALNELLKRYHSELKAYLRRYTDSEELAEDISQEVWMSVWQKAHQFKLGQNFRPWLYSVATNKAIDLMRKEKRHRSCLDLTNESLEHGGEMLSLLDITLARTEPSWLDVEIAAELKARILVSLTSDLRSVVQYIILDQLTFQEAAIKLGIPIGTVKSRMHAARQALQNTLGETVQISIRDLQKSA